MDKLSNHYSQLLGLDENWEVSAVDLVLDCKCLNITLRHVGHGAVQCPECQQVCPLADHAPMREWRHLDTMQFETRLHARVPRVRCERCGVKTVAVPWAGKHARFTLLFESFALEVLQAASNVQRAAQLLGLDWDSMSAILKRGVERGLERRAREPVKQVGLDEKSFGRGQSYISVLTDLAQSRVLEVVLGRDSDATRELWKSLDQEQRQQVEAVAMDMWPAFMNSAQQWVPGAQIVHDKFHVSKYLLEVSQRGGGSDSPCGA